MQSEQHDTPQPTPGLSRRHLLGGVATVLGSAILADTVGAFGNLGGTQRALAATGGSLTSNTFNVQVDAATAGVFTLANPADGYGTNYVINPSSHSNFDVDDSRWFGDLIFNVRPANQSSGTTMVSGLSDDIRTVSQSGNTITVTYNGNAANAAGFRGFKVVETYTLNSAGTTLTWSITVTNISTQALEFQDFGFPMLMNSYWSGDQEGIYEQNVSRHSFVAEDGSYIYWQRPNGVGPFLVMVPTKGTRLEYKNKARPGEDPFGEADPYWEGLVEYYVHSKNVAPARVDQAGSYLPATSLTLNPNASKTYGFTFQWAANYAGIRNAIYTAGGLDVISMPGMVIPTDTTATLAVRASGGIASVVGESGKNITVTAAGTANGYSLYKLSLPTLGANAITVTFGGSRTSVLQYYAIQPVEQLISRHAAFLVANQQAKTNRGYNGAFLQWNMATRQLVTWDNYPGGGWKEWMAGGSDDLGLSPAEFLAEKNLVLPVQKEVSAVDYWITNFLFGYLQNARDSGGKRTYQVYRWFDGQDGTPTDTSVWRAYNYTHIANAYFNMYRIRKAYPRLAMQYSAVQYLTFCYETLNAMFTKIPQPTPIGDAAHDLGLMGESTYPDILTALGAEGLTSQQSTLQATLQTKYRYFAGEAYPFASESSIDTTGFETSYTLGKMFGDTDLVGKVVNASLACRGLQPAWYHYGSDNRSMGESWWNLGYECQLGAWQQQDYLVAYNPSTNPDLADMFRSTYGAYLAGWANINSGQIDGNSANIGAAAWLYQSEKGTTEYEWIPNNNGWWLWSGESALGFWGAVRAASVNVVQDPVLGLYAYGGDVALSNGSYTITPRDGVRNKFTLQNVGNLTVRIANAQYTSATVMSDRTNIKVTLQNVSGGSYTATLTILFLPAGTYTVSAAGTSTTKTITSNGNPVVFDAPPLTAASTVLTIAKTA